MEFLLLVVAVFVGQTAYVVDAACTIPEKFRGTTWLDSVKGNISFTTWKLTHWGVGNTNVDEWEIADEVRFETDGYVAYRSLETFSSGGQTYYSYLCLKYEELSTDVYKYYTLHDPTDLADGERVLVDITDGLWRYTDICNESYPANNGIFNMMLTPGKEEEASVECPNAILGVFSSSVLLPNGTNPCGGSSLTSDSCTDKNDIQMNSSSCGFPVAYSASGRLSCLSSQKVGNYYYIYVYNHDDMVDNQSTYRFSCLVTDENGMNISISPSRCEPGQTPHDFPRDYSGQPMGMIIRNTANTLCRNEPITSDDDDGLKPWQIGVIAGGSALLLLILAVIIGCCCCRR